MSATVGDWFDALDVGAPDGALPAGEAPAAGDPKGPRGDDGLALLSDAIDGALDSMRARARGKDTPIPLPWVPVSEALSGGLWPGLHVLVGATGTGKTAFAVQAAVHAACPGDDRAPVPVLYVALELGKVDLVARCLSVLARRPWSDLYMGRTDPDDVRTEYIDRLRSAPFYLEVGGPHGWAYDTLHQRVAALRKRHPTGPLLVVLDFLQIVASPADRRREDLRERISGAAYACRAVARDHDAAVLALSSASRENAARLGVPRKEDRDALYDAHLLVGMGKESGDVEFSADSVVVLRKLEHVAEGDRKGTVVDVVVAKQRAGRAGFADPPLLFTGSWFDVSRDGRHCVVERVKPGKAGGKAGGKEPDPEPDLAEKYSAAWGAK